MKEIIKGNRYKLILAAIVAALSLGLLLSVTTRANAQEARPINCTVETVGTQDGAGGPHSKFTIENNTAFIKFNVVGGADCKQTVALKSWLSPSRNGTPHEDQKLFASVTRTFGVGQHRMSVALPPKDCFYQVDFVQILPGGNQILGFVLDGTKNCIPAPPPPATPVYTCNSMTLTKTGDRNVTTQVSYTAKDGATFSHLLYDFGDGTAVVRSANSTVSHTYAADGTYTARAWLVVTAGGSQKAVTSNLCSKQVTFTSTPPPVTPPPVTPPPTTPETPVVTAAAVSKQVPDTLVDTGTGDVVGILFSTIAGGALAYRLVWLRRLV